MKMYKIISIILISMILSACATTTEKGEVGIERRQLLLVPNEQVISMSADSYSQLLNESRTKNALDRNPDQVTRVNAVAKKLIPQTANFRRDALSWQWDVHVITSNDVNAFCMPGGKIAFYTALLDQLHLTDGEIAAVMGHEIAHALREHGRERMSEEFLKTVGLEVLIATGKLDEKYAGYANQLGAIAISLPHSRGQESEADEIGVELMARAGYDPHEALNLWKKMGALGGGKPPEILSTHPSDSTRLHDIESLIPKVMPLYKNSKN